MSGAGESGLCIVGAYVSRRASGEAKTRFPGHRVQTRRTLGAYPGMSLADARAKATEWYGLARRGVDPSVEEAKAAQAKARAEALAIQGPRCAPTAEGSNPDLKQQADRGYYPPRRCCSDR